MVTKGEIFDFWNTKSDNRTKALLEKILQHFFGIGILSLFFSINFLFLEFITPESTGNLACSSENFPEILQNTPKQINIANLRSMQHFLQVILKSLAHYQSHSRLVHLANLLTMLELNQRGRK